MLAGLGQDEQSTDLLAVLGASAHAALAQLEGYKVEYAVELSHGLRTWLTVRMCGQASSDAGKGMCGSHNQQLSTWPMATRCVQDLHARKIEASRSRYETAAAAINNVLSNNRMFLCQSIKTSR